MKPHRSIRCGPGDPGKERREACGYPSGASAPGEGQKIPVTRTLTVGLLLLLCHSSFTGGLTVTLDGRQ